MKLLYYCPLSLGGISDYTHEQANALQASGVEVSILCAPLYGRRPGARYRLIPELMEERALDEGGGRSVRRLLLGTKIVMNYRKLVRRIRRDGYRRVLLPYCEYMAPLWAQGLNRLKAEGVVMGAILHDPVRDYQVGPGWWHRWSVKKAYAPLTHVYGHGPLGEDIPAGVQQHRLVYGNHRADGASATAHVLREKWGFPTGQRILFSFGHLRDNKNLDLVIEALRDFPELFLVVAGRSVGGGNRPLAYYQKRAETLGCGDRCRWINRYVSAAEAAELFRASDLAVLTYAATYRSASASLNMAAAYQRPSLASGGSSHLQTMVTKYGLGIWVEPDSVATIKEGLRAWLENGLQPDWETYFQENSWTENAKGVIQTLWEHR